jgi:hypothetical protein
MQPSTTVILREGGVSSTPRPLDSIAGVSGILDRPPSRAMTARIIFKKPRLRDLAACFRARFAGNVLPYQKRAQGMPGAQCARSLVGRKGRSAHQQSSPRSHRNHPALPAQWFTAYFVLSPVIRIWLTPSSADNSTGLTPTSRRQDHTTSPSASTALVSRASASIASNPAFVTLRNAPL